MEDESGARLFSRWVWAETKRYWGGPQLSGGTEQRGEGRADDGPRRISHGGSPSQICHLYSRGERPPRQKSPEAGTD